MNRTEPETPAKPPKRLGRRIWGVFRVVWISAGIAFTLWLYDSFRARGIDEKTLQSNAQITVADTDEVIVFTPTEPKGPMAYCFFTVLSSSLAHTHPSSVLLRKTASLR